MSADKKLQIVVTQLQATPFNFPLDIEIKTASGKTNLQQLSISRKEETFTLNINEKVESIVDDPHTSLLFEGKINPAN